MSHIYLKNNRYLYFIDSNRIINAGIKDLFIKHAANKKIGWEDFRIDEYMIKSRIANLHQLIFETSQNCNLKCSYCLYGGSYFHQRKNSSKLLPFDIAAKTIDYIFGVIGKRRKNELIIGFYGGEPLLNFDVIQQIVDYSKRVFADWTLQFTITTNGTLLKDRVIRFLIENRFNLMISIDGSEKNHDRKRVFPDNSGTFHLIMDNVKNLKALDNDYYREYVSYLITYSKDLPIDDVYNFLLTDDRVNTNPVTLNVVNHLETHYYEKNPYNKTAANIEINMLIKSIAQKKLHGQPLAPIEENLFNFIVDMEKRTKKRHISFLSDACLFDKRIYIDTDGKFHICEKMNDRFPFGDCNKGFDFTRMIQITHEFVDLIKQKCIDCEARFLCNRCYIHFAKNGKFEMNTDFCDMNKKSIKKLEDIIELKEKGVLL
jgi:uncharacterized protein